VSEPLHVEVSELAAAQVRAAEAWWRLNRPKAPDALREELERASALIALQPQIGAQARNAMLSGVRRLHLARIRYDLYYRVADAPRRLEILAFWHASRGSDLRSESRHVPEQ
jgi:ParE-like toxin of type II ParDE toxin-antitoxin system